MCEMEARAIEGLYDVRNKLHATYYKLPSHRVSFELRKIVYVCVP